MQNDLGSAIARLTKYLPIGSCITEIKYASIIAAKVKPQDTSANTIETLSINLVLNMPLLTMPPDIL